MTIADIKVALKKFFGYNKFILGQEKLVNSILQKQDSLGIMPTGSGKSLCYQLPALIFDGTTIVISPLISLMKDQVSILQENGISSTYINSSLNQTEYFNRLDLISEGKIKIVYIAPERLYSRGFLNAISQNNINMVAVDEAHCVSQWGHDFRTAYLDIKNFIKELEVRPVVSAFTATATENVEEDIINQLELKNPYTVKTSYDRKNLYFEVRKGKDKFKELLEILSSEKGNSGIIYSNTRKSVESITKKLIQHGYRATSYHAGLNNKARKRNQEDFFNDNKPIMIATNAFGMGIDKSNVNFIVHYNMPKNLENYYQEVGRAGRDGSPANCILLYSEQDMIINKFLIEKTIEEKEYEDNDLKTQMINKEYNLLKDMQSYCFTNECYRNYILNYFGEKGEEYCGNCYNCNGNFKLIDVKEESLVIISAIKELIFKKHRNFGKGTIVDILKGSNTKKIRESSLNELQSYEKLADYSKEEINQIIEFLVGDKYLKIEGNKYPVLKLGKNHKKILNSENPTNMKIPIQNKNSMENNETINKNSITDRNIDENIGISKKNQITINRNSLVRKSERNKKNKTVSDDVIINQKLFDKLKELRLTLSKKGKIPPYIIFHDRGLREMCKYVPTNKSEFLEISGVENSKMEKYGEIFINLINENLSLVKEKTPLKDKSKINKPNETSNNSLKSKYKTNNVNKTNKSVNKKIKYNKNTNKVKFSNDDVEDTVLFNKLKELRLNLAKKERIPVYIIFSNKTLNEMCKDTPTTKKEFLKVSGVGEVKMKKYGNVFLKLINEHN